MSSRRPKSRFSKQEKTDLQSSRSNSRSKSKSKSESRSRKRSRVSSFNEERQKEGKVISHQYGNMNPITLEEGYSQEYKKIRSKVLALPASQPEIKQELWSLLDQTDIIILTGDTGSGKTTQVPKMVWEYLDYAETVICTQPRVLTAKSIAERVAKELDVKLGKQVGFRFRGSDKFEGGDITGLGILVYLTEGLFLMNTLKNPSHMSYYGAVIIDEAHDRTLDCDLLLYFIKHVMQTNHNLKTKFIIMSATMDKDKFINYFRDFNVKYMHIPGRAFPVDTKFLKKSIIQPNKNNQQKMKAESCEMIFSIVSDILASEQKRALGDILVFLPNNKFIDQVETYLNTKLSSENTNTKYKNYKIIKVSRAFQEKMSDQEVLQITAPISGMTKIVLSTNIAESGITVDGVYYVIETGLANQVTYSYQDRVDINDLNFISQAEAKQRRGRAGRTKSGICFHLYTQEEFNSFPKFRLPQIFRENFDHKLLEIINLFKSTPEGFDLVRDTMKSLIDPPKKHDYELSLNYLKQIKAYEPKGGRRELVLSDIGDCLLGLNDLDTLDLAYIYLTALSYEVDTDLLNILIAMMQIGSNLSNWFIGNLPKEFKSKYTNHHGDLFALYQIYQDYINQQIPEDYQTYLNTINFDKVTQLSNLLSQNKSINTSFMCHNQIKIDQNKRKKNNHLNDQYDQQSEQSEELSEKQINKYMFKKISLALEQALPDNLIDSELLEKNLKQGFYKNNFIDLTKKRKLLALSKIKLSSFGSGQISYDNFILF